ncbi:MAG TPA: GEVED domain-containing protein, partial [Chitinophagales bacterium]|nr:GEVED domain-containing protein [Chitinophagales bacterium]
MGISQVVFNSINVYSGTYNYTYQDYTGYSTNVNAGSVYTITVYGWNYSQYFRVWFDWNHNNVLEGGEQYDIGSGFSPAINITVPAGAVPGNTRMRVRSEYFYTGYPYDACNGVNYGETEDYTVNVIALAPPCLWTGVNNSTTHYGETRIVPPCDGSSGTLAAGSGTYQYFTLYNGSTYSFTTNGGSPYTPNLSLKDANPAWSDRAWSASGNISSYTSTYTGDHILITNRNGCQQHDFTGQSALIQYREIVEPGTVSGNASEICAGGSITFTRSGGTGIPRYWIARDGNYWADCVDCYDGQTSFTRQFNTPGSYIIRTHSRGAGSGCWNWAQASDFAFTVRAPVTNGVLTLNGSASNLTVEVGQTFTIAQGGGDFQGGNYWYWIGNDDDNVPGGWVGGSGWNYMAQGNANVGSFTYSFSTPGVYVIHTNANNVCGWGGGTTRFVTVKPPLLPLTGTQNLACGSTTTFKADRIQSFTAVGNSTFTVPSGLNGNVEVLVVGGGGGGGMDMGGGGGGGGVVYTTYPVTSGQAISVTVGGGGAGAPAACSGSQPCGHQYTIPASAGGNSVFGNIIAYG